MDQQSGDNIDPLQALRAVRDGLDGLRLRVDEQIARMENTAFKVAGETDDHLAYRDERKAKGQLSELGRSVMLELLKLGLTDEQVAARMSVATNSVGIRRRGWGRGFAQRG